MKKMNPKLKAKWVKALRSGKYQQGNGYLYTGSGYCCLGVLCSVMGTPKEKLLEKYFPGNAKVKTGLGGNVHGKLAKMNDGSDQMHRHSFKEIAGWVEANL